MAVALVAAALADPLVETVANTGILGPGYSDNDHASVLPALLAGAVLLLFVIVARCFGLLYHASTCRLALRIARQIAARAPLADLPYVLLLQFAALFAMESSEQLFFDGRLAGGTAWLGGPIWFSIFMHVLIGWVCTVLVAQAMRTIVRRCAALASIVLDRILCALERSNDSRFVPARGASTRTHARMLHVRQVGERAPPLLLALT